VQQALRSADDDDILRSDADLRIRRIGERNSLDGALKIALNLFAQTRRDRVDARR
jgi:hypothetical protein